MGYTKGEWKVEGKKILLWHPGWSDDRKVIADCNQWDGKEAEANAHLIAAAPDMYEACKAARKWLALFGEHTPIAFGGEPELDGKLSKALAKAEGK